MNRPLLSDYHTRVRGFATYDIALTAERSARRWMKTAKRSGRATVTGGGWWKIEGWYQRVQGYAALAIELRKRGHLDAVTGELTEGGRAFAMEGGAR